MIAATLPPAPPAAAIEWRNPGADPYVGGASEAARLFIRAGLPREVVAAQFRKLRDGRCHAGRIRQGDRLDLMLAGRGHVLRGVIAEPIYWPASAPRAAVVCPVARGGWVYRLIVPVVCRNFSEAITPLAGAALPPRGAPFGPAPGWAHWGGETGGVEESVGGLGGGFGAFAGGFSTGASGLSSAPVSEISFVSRERERRHFRRAAVEEYRRFVHRALFVPPPLFPPGESVPPVSGVTPPPPPGGGGSSAPASVPEPATGWLLGAALAVLGFCRWRIR